MNNRKLARTAGCIIAIIVLVIVATSCGELARPMIHNVPADWSLLSLTPYEEALYVGEYDEQSGLIEYARNETYDIIQIFYERAPEPDLTPNDLEQDAEYIFSRDLEYMPDETGTMAVADTTAGYARGYDLDFEVYDLEIILVLDNVYLDVYAGYASPETGDEIMEMIDSISLG